MKCVLESKPVDLMNQVVQIHTRGYLDTPQITGLTMQLTSPWLATILGLAIGSWASGIQAEIPATVILHHQPCYTIVSPEVRLCVTELGGHMAPVTFFHSDSQPIQPYHISPWQDEPATEMPAPVLVPLRGDFFCMPFGGNADPVHGEKHPPHGEIAGAKWHGGSVTKSGDITTLTMQFETQVRPGKVTKQLSLVNGHNAVYSKHTIEGFAGPAPLGHHATLRMPEKEGAVHLASSPIQFGMTYPGVFSDPKNREYQALLPGARFDDLTRVPALAKGSPDADLSSLPGQYGHADLIQHVNAPTGEHPAWMTATYPDDGYVWFALKDPQVLNSTVFWMEYHGRHGHPWNGRNNCLGLEDVTAYFADGLSASAHENLLTKAGVKTAVKLSATVPTEVRYIQGVAKISQGFDRVRTIEFSPGRMTILAPGGQKVEVPVNHEFLKTGQLQ